ncbi:MAG: metallophosphoesterase [Chitinophagales bacterium]|nr:metallophosphoesterase [Chitinophagales bacterium]
MNRRQFITQVVQSSFIVSSFGRNIPSLQDPDLVSITLMHTNDTHSHIDPFEYGEFQGKAGIQSRKKLIDQIRKETKHSLLLDAGDYFQGTPYFNMYQGEIEIKAMSMLGYDYAMIGNHDFDGGIENLAKQIKNHANFEVICSNYIFTNTPMKGLTKPYVIREFEGINVGIFGIGIELQGLVDASMYGDTQYLKALETANETALKLKKDENCDLVIMISHLGFSYQSKQLCDIDIAKNSLDIDVIIGGHTHTFLSSPKIYKNKNGQDVLINQVGWAGIKLGQV